MERLNIIWIIIIEIILTVYTECPLPWELLRRVGILLSVYQIYLCGHSNRHQVMDQKSSFFICPRVSARFLHCFCTVSRDAMGTLTCKIRQRVQKLLGRKSRCFAQKWRKLETSKIRVFCPVALLIRGPGIRVPSSAPKSHEESQDSSWDFPFSGGLHTFAHFLHTGGMICTPNTGHTVLGVHISKIAVSGGAFLWIRGRFYRKSNTDYGYIRVSTREQHEARNMPVSSFYYDGKF